MNFELEQYLPLVNNILRNGKPKPSRAGDTISLFGEVVRFNSKDVPILQGRRMFTQGILGELAAILRGPRSVEDFKKYGCNYWDKWADDNGQLRLDYGNAWLDFNGVNQLEKVVHALKTNPNDRRLLISGWNPANIPTLSLPCCHLLYQWYVNTESNTLDMIWYQRSTDVMVGLPSDALFACVFNRLLANTVGMKPGIVTMVLGDSHIYANHVVGALEYCRMANNFHYGVEMGLCHIIDHDALTPKLTIDDKATVYNFDPSMCKFNDYPHQPAIKFSLNG